MRTVARSPIASSLSDFGSLRSYLVRRDLRLCPYNIQVAEDRVRSLARNKEGKINCEEKKQHFIHISITGFVKLIE